MTQGTSRGRQDKKQSVVIIPEGGRIPPQATEMEEAVLGAAMLEKMLQEWWLTCSVRRCFMACTPEDFCGNGWSKAYSGN